MDFQSLIKPYSENGRTIEGQMKWLQKKGILQDSIDLAMLDVYSELEKGKSFENGTALDHYLLSKAIEREQGELITQYERLCAKAAKMEHLKKYETGKCKKLWMVMKGEL